MNQTSILIIGAGIGQVPLLKKAQNRGLRVVVASIEGNYPCLKMADEVIYCDIYDRDKIVEEAKKRNIKAVISDQNDLMNPTVAYVSEKLGIPGNRFDTVMSYCNKNYYRNICENVGIPVPRHCEVNRINDDVSFVRYPCMVKPADSQSSIAVKKVDNENEIKSALKMAIEASHSKTAICEEYFSGVEVVCEGFINNGNYYLLDFADRNYFKLEGLFIPNQTIFPSKLGKNYLDKIVEYEKKMAAYTNPAFAIVHSEYLVNVTTGEIRVVESALRGGGVYISSDLIPMATGIDINEILLDKALGKDVAIDKIFSHKIERAAAYICFYLPEGVIIGVEGVDELLELDFVKKVFLDEIKVGKKVNKMTYKGDRLGPILLDGKDRQEIENNIKKIQQVFKVFVQKEDGGIANIIWE